MFRRGVSAAAVLSFGFSGSGSKDTAYTTAKDIPSPHIRIYQPEKKAGDGFLLSRKIVNDRDVTGLNLRLYQYETCPFCCKLRVFLDYYGFSYEVVEVNPVLRDQLKAVCPGYKKVPVLRVDDAQNMKESSLIISQLATLIARPDRTLAEVTAMYPEVETVDERGKAATSHPNKYFVMLEKMDSAKGMASAKEEREWREWVDNHFIHLISPNVYATLDESIDTFQWFQKVGEWHRVFASWERCLAVYVGAFAMWLIAKRLKTKHQITDERAALREACDAWTTAMGPTRKFMGGDEPNLADLALFGAMQSFYGCKAFKECCSEGRIAEWYGRVKAEVDGRRGQTKLAARKAYK